MNDDLRRRILFFSLPVFLGAMTQAVTLAVMHETAMGFLGGIVAAIAAFIIGFHVLDDRACVILEDEAYKPGIGLMVGLGIGLTLSTTFIPAMFTVVFVAFGGYAGISCVASYLGLDRAITKTEKRGMTAAVLGQLAVLTLAFTSTDVAVPGMIAGASLVAVVFVRFWTLSPPVTDVPHLAAE